MWSFYNDVIPFSAVKFVFFFDKMIMLKSVGIGELFRDFNDVFTFPILLQE